jgi:CheY-like chemotaxis protein
MKIVLLSREPSESERLATILRGAGHQLTVANDGGAVSASLKGDPAQVALLSVHGADDAIIALVRDLRSRPAARAPYLALLASGTPEEFLIRAYEAGIDADIPLPIGPALLVARLRATERLVLGGSAAPRPDAHAKAPARVVPVVAPAAAATPSDATHRPASSAAWREAPDSLSRNASTFLTLPVTVGEIPVGISLDHASVILLSSVQDQLEVRIAVGAETASARQLAIHMFGPDSDDLATDMLGELTNIFMGALKNSFHAESLPFTGGLPAMIEPARLSEPFKHQQSFLLGIDQARLVVHLGLRSKANVHLAAAALREGMVLAKDVFNARGLMLLAGGTRLSLNMIERLHNALAPKVLVEVMAP